MHVSPPCTTYSSAHHNNNFHRDGLQPLTPDAVLDDDLTRHMCELMSTFSSRHPDVLLSQENPVGLWQQLPWVRQLAEQPGWQLIQRIDHCMMTSSMDEHSFPNKPTSYLVYNCEYQPGIVCNCQCDNRLTSSGNRKLHRVLICRNAGMHPDQQVLTGVLEKGRIPLMLFGHLVAKHACP